MTATKNRVHFFKMGNSSILIPKDDPLKVIIDSLDMCPEQATHYAELWLTPSFFGIHTFYQGSEYVTNPREEGASFIIPTKFAREKGLCRFNQPDFEGDHQFNILRTWLGKFNSNSG
ncbi:hypothetical protein N9195_01860 [bacterium]|nr:hypothetical protein [bacterium]